jgi:dihydroorotate dehydrogenase
MNLYRLLRPFLFQLSPETAHRVTLRMLDMVYASGISRALYPEIGAAPVEVMGLNFKNRVGLAAGLDKDGDHIGALAALGFGFIEIGTVTPRPQPGNPQPRLFRLPEHQAIINRMGFNNSGVDHLIEQVRQTKYQGILGINIGKNFDTPIEQATEDYLTGFRKVYPYASYVTINISSPNTKNLRQLQQTDELKILLSALKEEQFKLAETHLRYVPVVVKIAPDLSEQEIAEIARLLVGFAVDGVIATNTTLDRSAVAGHPLAGEAGGLSGAPVRDKSTAVVRRLAEELNGRCPIIAAGGILSADDAQEKIAAGAKLVQIYSGLIYQGPRLIAECVRKLSDMQKTAD